MITICWCLIILFLICIVICTIPDKDPIINKPIMTIGCFIAVICFVGALSDESERKGYKQGQTDALNGKWKYKIERIDTIKQPIITPR